MRVPERQARILIEQGLVPYERLQSLWPLIVHGSEGDLCELCERLGLISAESARAVQRRARAQSGGFDFQHGRYRLQRELGRGAMGRVYLATLVATGELVVIKTLLSRGHEPRERFQREAEALARLSHENIVGVREFGESQGQPFLVMDFIDGRTLDRVIRESLSETGQVPDTDVLIEYFSGLAGALASMHAQALIHRDIKPSNILIENGSGRVVLVDLGLAKDQGGDYITEAESLTKSGQMLGSPGFMAPEQLSAKEGVAMGPWTDVWGLGATLFYCLTGDLPVTGRTFLEMAVALSEARVRTPRSINTGVPRWLDRICGLCMQLDTEARPAMPELQRAFESRSADGLGPDPRRRRLWFWASLVVLGLAVFAAWASRDTRAPVLDLEFADSVLRVNERELVLRGRVKDDRPLAVLINGQEQAVDKDGHFRKRVRLRSGVNEFQFKGLDEGRLESAVTALRVIFDDQQPRLELLPLSFDKPGFMTVTGRLNKAGCEVEALGLKAVVEGQRLYMHCPLERLKAGVELRVRDAFGNESRWALPMRVVERSERWRLTQSIKDLPERGVVFVKPGRYDFSMTLSKSVTFVGLGPRAQVVFETNKPTLAEIRAGRVCFRGLTLNHRGRSPVAIRQLSGRLEFHDCDIDLAAGRGIVVGEAQSENVCEFVMANCVVNSVVRDRLRLVNTRVVIENTLFHYGSNEFQAFNRSKDKVLFLRRCPSAKLIHCDFRGLANGGIYSVASHLWVIGSDFESNKGQALHCRDGELAVLGCRFFDNGADGLAITGPSKVDVVACEFERNGRVDSGEASLRTDNNAQLWVLMSSFRGSQSVALYKQGESRASLSYCQWLGGQKGAALVDYPEGLSFHRSSGRVLDFPAAMSRSPLKPVEVDILIADLKRQETPPRVEAFFRLKFAGAAILPKLLAANFNALSDAEAQMLKMRLLGMMGPAAAEAVPFLVNTGLQHDNKILRDSASWALSQIGVKPAQRPLLEALFRNKQMEIRLQALELAAALGAKLSFFEDRLKRQLLFRETPVRAGGTRTLARVLKREEALKLVRGAARDHALEVRSAAFDGWLWLDSRSAQGRFVEELNRREKVGDKRVLLWMVRPYGRVIERSWGAELKLAGGRQLLDLLVLELLRGAKGWRELGRSLDSGLWRSRPEALLSAVMAFGALGPRASERAELLAEMFREGRSKAWPQRLCVALLWALRRMEQLRLVADEARAYAENELTGVVQRRVRAWLDS